MSIDFLDAFPTEAFTIRWQDRKEAEDARLPFLGRALFDDRSQVSLKLKYLVGSGGLPISLMPSTFDAKAKFRQHIGFSEIETKMPFFREGYFYSEDDLRMLDELSGIASPLLQEMIDRIFGDDVFNLIEGGRVVPERMIWQLLAPENGNVGITFKLDDKSSNNGTDYTYNYDPNGTWKPKNYIEITGAADKWSAVETATPLSDIQNMQTVADDNNSTELSTMIMSPKTFNYLVQNKSIKDYIVSRLGQPQTILTPADTRRAIADLYGLNIITYRKKYRDESGTTRAYYPDNYVTFIPSGNLGSMFHSPTPEELRLRGKVGADVTVVENHLAITQILNPHPVTQELYVSKICLPTYPRMDEVYVMKVA